ncbi:DsbA family protein [Burkholderia alba]|uniref:DsbA family protein n=1 Tax=Burkholderia alba TaxID=2683677 RepID=UPI002B05C7B8|nr:DsbA family protein [Burkholderia alba]
MNTLKLQYFFDPLCGWCYAAAPALAGLAEAYPHALELMPSGLFAGEGARDLTPEWGDYAWRNDQRIEQLTGQRFTAAYRSALLQRDGVRFDSGPATLALTAIRALDAALERPLLQALQVSRYVEGLDTARPEVLGRIAARVAAEAGRTVDADEVAGRIAHDPALAAATDARVVDTRRRMQQLGTSGVPQLLLTFDDRGYVLQGANLYSGPQTLIAAVEQALHRAGAD